MSQEEIDADPAHYKTARPGDGRYVDVNKDGVLDAGDRTLIGDPNPKFIWGFTNNFKYKDFDLSFCSRVLMILRYMMIMLIVR